MRRKLGILILVGVTVLAGTQEAVRQFQGLKSSLTELTRASLWSGLIVYAQPVADGKLPSPQIYYLMPQPTATAAPQEATLVNNSNNAATPSKPEAQDHHAAAEVAASTDAASVAAAKREVEEVAKSEFVLDKLPLKLAASHFVAPRLEKMRVYEEVARNETVVRQFKEDGEAIAKVFMKEFDTAKLNAEMAQLAAAHEQIENLKLKTTAEAGNLNRRMEIRIMRHPARPARPARVERIVVLNPFAEKGDITLPEMSSIGCEKTRPAKPIAFVETPTAKPAVATSVGIASEPVVVDPGQPAGLIPTSTTWALGCDNEPEQK